MAAGVDLALDPAARTDRPGFGFEAVFLAAKCSGQLASRASASSRGVNQRTRDDIVRDLVARGVVPAATLDDGTQITSPRSHPAQRTRDDIVRDLVERGLVPAATLDDGTQITGPAPAPAPRTRDDIVRDLVERGLVPAAILDDGTQITSRSLDT